MTAVTLFGKERARVTLLHERDGLALGSRLPSLCVCAREAAASVMHGIHGRRRAGTGETFWQFRPFISGEAAGRIDWRRSAKDDRLYVREREWEAAHMVFIWIDRSPSMWFASSLARQPKIDRALVLGLASAFLLVRGGERAGLLGLTPAIAARNIIERFAGALAAAEANGGSPPEELPREQALPRGARALLIGDFLSDPVDISKAINGLSAQGARGHLLVIADPAEESFPFSGNTEFVDVDSPQRLRAGQAETFREDYIARLAAHREAIGAAARRRGWTVSLHRTGKPAAGALLALKIQLDAMAGAVC